MQNIQLWQQGKYDMPEGTSRIRKSGEGSQDWDAAAFNMLLVNETERFLDNHFETRENDPFFAFVALGSVHIPHTPPTVYMDGTPIAGQYPSGHMDMLSEMDKVVGSLLQQLEDREVLEDTLIIFTSDNGGLGTKYSKKYGHNSHGPLRGVKGQIYEGGHRVPLILRWDNGNIPQNQTRNHLVGLNDLFATISELAGVDVPQQQAMDSVSFANYAKNADDLENLRQELGVWLFKDSTLAEESIRYGSFKLIRTRASGTLELYDLETDISETTNLINNEAYKSQVNDMLSLLGKITPCEDSIENFDVRINGQKETTNCQWFANDKQRCKVYLEGQYECRLSCAPYDVNCSFLSNAPSIIHTPTSNPTSNPTRPPISDCSDSILNFKIKTNNITREKNCIWVSKKQKRCSIYGVSRTCPLTCGHCVCSRSPLKWEIDWSGKKKWKNCNWVKNDKHIRCQLPGVSGTCRSLCEDC
jgi:hypothetical protein